jgi:hypothetical protein
MAAADLLWKTPKGHARALQLVHTASDIYRAAGARGTKGQSAAEAWLRHHSA